MTDIEGSTRLWSQHEDVMASVILRHDELIADAVAAHRGDLVRTKGEGDSTFSVFASPRDALAASVDVQRALESERWPRDIALRSRAAIHTGEVQIRDGEHFGSTINRCARLRAIAHGGQVICSQATADLVADDLPHKVSLRDMGSHGLRDLSRPERVFQICHPELADDFPALASLGSARTNLPAQRTTFLGRDDELRTIAGHLAKHRLVTLTGVGGCGKTRLAIEAAAREVGAFDGVYFCDLSPIADPEVVAYELAKAIGVGGSPLIPSTQFARDGLLDFLQDRRVLIVVDNCEHVVEAAANVVDDVLAACANVTILATSREALEVDGERTYTVPSLPVPEHGKTDSVAVRLFADRAAATNAAFALTPEVAVSVAEICRRLDGIPLAIELAAAQSGALSPQQIAERLSDRFRLLSGGRRRVQRQQTLATMLDWSYDLLDEEEQATLRALAVFPQSFTLEQAEGIAGGEHGGPVAGTIRSLVSKSLVTASGDRYRLLETVRLYVEQKLLDAGEAESLRSRHCDYFVQWVRSFDADDQVWTSGVGAVLVPEFDHIRAAIRWSDERGDLVTVASLICRGWLASTGSYEENRAWFDRAEAAHLPDDERLRFVTAKAWQATSSVDFPRMLTAADEAISLPRDPSGFCHASAHAFLALAHGTTYYLTGAGDPETTRRHIDQAFAASESPYARAMASIWCGLALVALGDLPWARRTFVDALAIERQPDTVTGATLTCLALVEGLLGDDEAGLAAMERSARVFATDPWGLATDYNRFWTAPYGPALFIVGREREGVAFMEDLVGYFTDVPIQPNFVRVILGCLGLMLVRHEHHEDGAAFLIQGFEQPLAALDHMYFQRYLDQVRRALGDDVYERGCAEGRLLTLADARRALDTLWRDLDAATTT